MRLFFVTPPSAGDYLKVYGFRGFLWLCLNHPKVAYQLMGVSLMVILIGRKSHVLIENYGTVLDYCFRDTRVFSLGDLGKTRYTIHGKIHIFGRLTKPVRLCDKIGPRNDSLIKTTLGYLSLWATRGRARLFTKSDCVTIAKYYLRSAGLNVPPSVWTPQQLIDWIESRGEFRFDSRIFF